MLIQGSLLNQLPCINILAHKERATHLVTQAVLYEYVRDYMERGTAANRDFLESHKANPLVNGQLKLGGEPIAMQRALEEKYLSAETLDKYQRSAGRGPT